MARKILSSRGSFVRDKKHPFETYHDICRKSNGFDVPPSGGRITGGVAEVDLSIEHILKTKTELAKFAVDHYNKSQNGDLEFVSLARANGQGCSGYFHYLTFWARPRSHKHPKPYQAKIFEKRFNQGLEVRIFRRRPKSNPYKLPGPKPSSRKVKEKEPKRPSVPKGAFVRFMNDLRKLPELANMKYRDVASLASRIWKSLSVEDKVRHYRKRSLKYEDIAEFKPALAE